MLGMTQRKLRNLLLFFGVLYLSFGTQTCYAEDKSDETKALLKERRDLLSEAATRMYKIYQAFAQVDHYQELIQVHRDSLKADLDWFDKPEDRIQAIEKHKKAADEIYLLANRVVDSGRADKFQALQAKAYVFEVQLELVKEKKRQKAKPGK